MPDSNKNWKSKYFFVQGTNWVCKPEEWDSMPNRFDDNWGVLDKSSESSVSVSLFILLTLIM